MGLPVNENLFHGHGFTRMKKDRLIGVHPCLSVALKAVNVKTELCAREILELPEPGVVASRRDSNAVAAFGKRHSIVKSNLHQSLRDDESRRVNFQTTA